MKKTIRLGLDNFGELDSVRYFSYDQSYLYLVSFFHIKIMNLLIDVIKVVFFLCFFLFFFFRKKILPSSNIYLDKILYDVT